ncbi:MAG: hypothetical protein WAX04_02615, partial [Oscillospiraceae bacterium]
FYPNYPDPVPGKNTIPGPTLLRQPTKKKKDTLIVGGYMTERVGRHLKKQDDRFKVLSYPGARIEDVKKNRNHPERKEFSYYDRYK